MSYLCDGFREKNKDTLHPDLSAVMRESQSPLVRELFPHEVQDSTPTRKPRKGKNVDKMTVGSQFMVQLASLMRTINSTDVHYARCITPNTKNLPQLFDMVHSGGQLRCAGVLEAVRISRMAYPNRMPHSAFARRYALLAAKVWRVKNMARLLQAWEAQPGDAGACALCTELLALLIPDAKRYQMGKTKVFFRAFLLETLEQDRGKAMSAQAPPI